MSNYIMKIKVSSVRLPELLQQVLRLNGEVVGLEVADNVEPQPEPARKPNTPVKGRKRWTPAHDNTLREYMAEYSDDKDFWAVAQMCADELNRTRAAVLARRNVLVQEERS